MGLHGSLGLTGSADTTRPFLIRSANSDDQYVFTLSMAMRETGVIGGVRVIRDNGITQSLSFEWFKANFICQDHPEECDWEF